MNKKLVFLFIATILIALPYSGLAQTPGPKIVLLPGGKNLGDLIQTLKDIIIDNILWNIAIAFVIIMFTLAGFKFLTAQGDTSKVAEARNAVIWGLAGTVVIVLAWSAITLVKRTLGIP